jgi:hypothetical protein
MPIFLILAVISADTPRREWSLGLPADIRPEGVRSMKFVLPAVCAVVLLADGAGCCRSCCRTGLLARNCSNGGCGPRFRFNWSRCRDTCDQCGNWTGAPVIERQNWQDVGYAEDLTESPQACRGRACRRASRGYDLGYDYETAQGYHLVHGDHGVMHSGRSSLARTSGQRAPAMMNDKSVEDEIPSAPRVIRRSGNPTLARTHGRPTPAMLDDGSDSDEIPVTRRSSKATRVSRGRTIRSSE